MKFKRTIIIAILLILLGSYIGYKAYTNNNTNNTIEDTEFGQVIARLNVSDFKAELDAGDKILIDIRTQDELDLSGLIKGNTLHIDIYESDFTNTLDKLDKSKKYLIYCAHGNRSKSALDIMKNKGFKYVKDLEGGITTWIDAGMKVFK